MSGPFLVLNKMVYKTEARGIVGDRVGIGTTLPFVSLEVNSTDAVLLPKGSTNQRPFGVSGYIRYNTELDTFEGFGAGDAWGSLGGVKSTDQLTYITAENDCNIRFYTGGQQRAILNSNGHLGIGTGHVQYPLHVNGDALVTDTLYACNIVFFNHIIFSSNNAGLNYNFAIQPTHYTEQVSDVFGKSNFSVTVPGQFKVEPNQTYIYINGSKLGYINEFSKDYTLTYQIFTSMTQVEITLNQPVYDTDVIDIIIYPTTLTSNQVGYFIQNINTYWEKETSPNDIYYTSGNVGIGTTIPQEKLHLLGNLFIEGNILPTSCNVYDIGTSNLRFRDIYLSGNTIDLGGTLISRNSANGQLIVSTQSGEPVDISANSITVLSSNLVNNLNAQYLNGKEESYYTNATNINDGNLAIIHGGTGAVVVTGSGSNVLSASPTLTGTVLIDNLTASGTVAVDSLQVTSSNLVANLNAQYLNGKEESFYTNATNMNTGALNPLYGGTGSTTVTGSGSNVLSASPTLTGTIQAANLTASGTVAANAITVSSSNLITNLNAQYLNGKEESFYTNATNINTGALNPLYGGTGSTSVTGSGSNVLSASPTLTGTVLIENVTASGTVAADFLQVTSSNLITNLNAQYLNGKEESYYTNATNINNGALNPLYGGTGSTSVTGSGSNVLSASPTLTGTTTLQNTVLTGNLGIGITNSTIPISINTQTTNAISITNGSHTLSTGILNNEPFMQSSIGMNFFMGNITAWPGFSISNKGELGIATAPANAMIAIDQSYKSTLIETFSGSATDPKFILRTASELVVPVGFVGKVEMGVVANNPYVFLTNNTERVRILADGNVGIGLTNPTEKLEVSGIIKATSFSGPFTTSQTLWGQSFNGSSSVSGNISNAGTIQFGTQTNKATLTYTTDVARTVTVPDPGNNAFFVMTEGTQTINGSKTFSQFAVNNSNLVTNLNADLLDGQQGSYYTNVNNMDAGTLPVARGGTGQITLTANKVLVGNTTSGILQPANLHWDTTNSRLGINNQFPSNALDVVGNAYISGTITASNLSIIGDFVTMNTVTSNTEQMVINNTGTGPALRVIQTGNTPLAEFFDSESGSAMFIDNNGLIGFSTNVPLAKLYVLETGSVDAFRVDDQISDTTPFIIKADGKVGIGLTNPQDTLHVEGNIVLSGGDRSIGVQTFNKLILNTINKPRFTVDGNGNVGIGLTNPLAFLHIENATSSNTFDVLIKTQSHTTATFKMGGSGYDLLFQNKTDFIDYSHIYTQSSGSYDTLKLNNSITILGSGLVGIGTATPQEGLHLEGNLALSGDHRFVGTRTNHNLSLRTNNTDRITILSNGNVGIGSATPVTILDVGTGTIRGSLLGNVTGNVSGTSANVTGTVAVANGGTGQTTLTANKVLVGNATTGILQPANLHWDNTNSRLGIGSATPGVALDVNGTVRATAFSGPLTGNVTGNVSGTAANVTGTVAVANGGTGVTTSTGTGSVVLSASPTFTGTVSAANITATGFSGPLTGNVSGTATNATNVTVTNDTSTNAVEFITFVGANSGNLAINTNSSQLTFNPSTGTVGIGTTVPRQKLDVVGNIQVSGSLTSGAITSTTINTQNNSITMGTGNLTVGNVGIGTTNPQALLHLYSATTSPSQHFYSKLLGNLNQGAVSWILLCRSSGGGRRLEGRIFTYRDWGSSNDNSTIIQLHCGANQDQTTTYASMYLQQGGNHLFDISLVTVTYNSLAYLAIKFNSTVAFSGYDGAVYFTGSLTHMDELLVVINSGLISNEAAYTTTRTIQRFTGNVNITNNLGIGIVTPQEPLQVEGFVRSSSGYKVGATTVLDSSSRLYTANTPIASSVSGISIGAINIADVTLSTNQFATALKQTTVLSGGWRQHLAIGNFRTGSGWNGGCFIAVGVNDSNTDQYFLFSAGGTISHSSGNVFFNNNVGINTSSPQERLHIEGNIALSGASRFVGTRTNHNLSLRTNNTDRITIDTNGNVGIGVVAGQRSYTLSAVDTGPGSVTVANVSGATIRGNSLDVASGSLYVTAWNGTFVSGDMTIRTTLLRDTGNNGTAGGTYKSGDMLIYTGDVAVDNSAANAQTCIPGNILFGTGTIFRNNGAVVSGTNPIWRMAINGTSGSVGIGTTVPDYTLTVRKDENTFTYASVRNANSGNAAHVGVQIQNNASQCVWYLNSSGKTTDGGINTATLRNDAGDIRLLGSGSVGLFVKGSTGKTSIGPNISNPAGLLEVFKSSSTSLSDASPQTDYHLLLGTNSLSTGENSGIAFTIYASGAENGFGAYPTYPPGAAIVHERTAVQSVGKLHFKTRAGTGATDPCITRMTIDQTGSVGIGTTIPRDVLDVNGGLRASSGTFTGSITIDGSVQSSLGYRVGDIEVIDSSGNIVAGGLNLVSSSGTPALTVTAAGNVGIGTATPVAALHVNGSIGITSTITNLTAGNIPYVSTVSIWFLLIGTDFDNTFKNDLNWLSGTSKPATLQGWGLDYQLVDPNYASANRIHLQMRRLMSFWLGRPSVPVNSFHNLFLIQNSTTDGRYYIYGQKLSSTQFQIFIPSGHTNFSATNINIGGWNGPFTFDTDF